MKKAMLVVAAFGISTGAMAASYDLDPPHTIPNFTINHLGFSTMHGMFTSSKGTLELDLDKKTGSVDVTIDTASIFTGFAKRDEHLRSPDFFNTAEFPTMTFKSTDVKFKGDKAATVEGNLTIMGTTKKVTLNVDHIHCAVNPMSKKDTCGFNATTAIKRSDFGIKYALPAIGDDVAIELEVEAIKK
jgi:polyisoprenoid-binding protein YceI